MTRPSLAQRALPWLVIAAVGALLYARALFFGFTNYDDAPLLVAHHAEVADPRIAIASFFRDAFALLGPEARAVFYRPMLWVSYTIDAQLGGARPAIYHATNLLLHIAACGAVYALLRRLGYGLGLALGLALALCVHPALTSVVAWIPCRNDSLLAIFALLTVLALLRFLERPGLLSAALVLLALAATLFTKESGIALLAVLPAVAFVEGGRRRELRPRLLALAVGVALVAALWFVLRRTALGAFPVALANPFQQIPIAIAYLGKTFLPLQLSVYPNRADISLLPGLIGIALLAALAYALRRRLFGRAGLGFIWYFAFLAPALCVADQTQGFEHRLYLPWIGLLICFAELAQEIPARRRPAAAALGIALLCAGALMSFRRLPEFASDTSFWESATRSSPSSESAWRTLAWRYFEHGRYAEAEASARRALTLHPDEPRSHLLLGIALAQQHRLSEAEPALQRAVALDPDYTEAWQNLALLQRKLGQHAASGESQRRAEAAATEQPQ